MSVIHSPTRRLTTATAQYLFRVYRRPIRHTSVLRLEGCDVLSDEDTPGVASGFALNFDDHLFSIPATTEAILDTASRLAYATALLCVGDIIPFIAVFLVEAAKGIDRFTPITVLTPWQSRELRHKHDYYLVNRKAQMYGVSPFGPFRWNNIDTSYEDICSFASYDLLPPGAEAVIPDPFVCLDVVRATTRGRNRHQWFKNVLTKQDYFFNEKGELFLTSFGSCSLARFPWFQATMEQMQWTHSGYDVTEDGRLILGNEALTERVANAAIDAAQQRRMFLRRSWTHQKVLESWWIACTQLSYALRIIEVSGWAEASGYGVPNPPGASIHWTRVPTIGISRALSAVVEFLNVLWLAEGSPSLAIWLPFTTYSTEYFEFARVSHLFSEGVPPGGVHVPWLSEDEDSQSIQIAMAMQDLCASVMAVLWKYCSEHRQTVVVGWNYLPPLSNVYVLAAGITENQFAEQYETVQGDLQALFSLLCLWQFTFRPHEPSKNPLPSRLFKTVWKYGRIWNRFDQYEKDAAEGARMVDFSGRINDEVPVFSPPRTWEVKLVANDLANQYNAAVRLQKEQQLQAVRDAETARHEQAKAARRQQLQGQLALLQSQTQLAGHPNPLDPYDWRNYMSSKWWATPISADDVPQFISNMRNTPDAISIAEDVFNLSPKAVNGLRRLEPLISVVEDIANPHIAIRRALKNLTWKRVKKIAGVVGWTYVQHEAIVGYNVYVKSPSSSTTPGYEERDLWPDGDPLPDPPPPPTPVPVHHPPPFDATATGFGGGTSGGGGAEGTWDEDHAYLSVIP